MAAWAAAWLALYWLFRLVMAGVTQRIKHHGAEQHQHDAHENH